MRARNCLPEGHTRLVVMRNVVEQSLELFGREVHAVE